MLDGTIRYYFRVFDNFRLWGKGRLCYLYARRNRPTIGLMGNEYYLQMLHTGEKVRLHKLDAPDVLTDVKKQYPEITKPMKDLLPAIYHTSLYMMENNKKQRDG